MALPVELQPLRQIQKERFFYPYLKIREDLEAVYLRNEIVVGWPYGAARIFEHLVRDNTAIIVAVELGDEGKGRLVDNKVKELLSIPGIKLVTVIRFQGGSNAGHTVEKGDIRLALHQVPSGVMYEETVGIMDRGMTIHPEELQIEVGNIEDKVGDLRGKLYLSEEAILGTDLERAEEVLNKKKQGRTAGGTGRGISPAYAHRVDRLGLKIDDLMNENWRETLGRQYDRYQLEFAAYGIELAEVEVPDFKTSKEKGTAISRTVGTKEEFLDRLETARTWLINRQMVKNTFLLHRQIYQDLQTGVLFEGAQALGLNLWLGTEPDRTSSDTSVYGVIAGTALWRPSDIKDRIGVLKATYTSSVGARHMPTQVDLAKDVRKTTDLPKDASAEEQWAAWVREEAHEFGTTTGRPRDICHLDLALLTYNAYMSGIEMLAVTHLDIARERNDTGEEERIAVCTHYEDEYGNYVPYQPGLKYQEKVIPKYVYLPSWDGEAVRRAKSFDELPENAQKFLAFIQRRTGFPVVITTTGPEREQMVKIPEYRPESVDRFFMQSSA